MGGPNSRLMAVFNSVRTESLIRARASHRSARRWRRVAGYRRVIDGLSPVPCSHGRRTRGGAAAPAITSRGVGTRHRVVGCSRYRRRRFPTRRALRGRTGPSRRDAFPRVRRRDRDLGGMASSVESLLSKEASAGAWGYLFFATASHGVLDAMTSGGLGVAFFAPFSNARYFLPWRPIAVSPIGLAAFFSSRGLHILANEIIWIWTPSGLLALALILKRRIARADDSSQKDGSAPFADRSASWNGVVLSGTLMLVVCGSLMGVYAWVGPREIRENRYGTYAETRTPEARWLALVLPPSATVIHERHAIDIDLLYGSFRFDPAERREFETMLAPGFRSNVRIDRTPRSRLHCRFVRRPNSCDVRGSNCIRKRSLGSLSNGTKEWPSSRNPRREDDRDWLERPASRGEASCCADY